MNYITYMKEFRGLKIEDVKKAYESNNKIDLMDIARGYISHLFDNDLQNDVVDSYINTTNRVKSVCVNHTLSCYDNGYLVDDYDVYLNDIDLFNDVILRDTDYLFELAKESYNNIIEELQDANIDNNN